MEYSHETRFSPPATLPPELLDALRQPFPPDEVHVRVGRQRCTPEGAWLCEAIPWIDARTCETRLDQVVPGGWSTTSPSLVVVEGRLIISARVQIGASEHTDYAELPLSSATLLHETAELLVTVPDAFEHAFVRACARFGIGRSLAHLPRLWVSYDTARKQIALSPEQQRTHLRLLYQQARISGASPTNTDQRSIQANQRVPRTETVPSSISGGTVPDGNDAQVRLTPLSRDALRTEKIAWVRQQCATSSGSLARILTHWQITNLEALSNDDLRDVVVSIQQSHARIHPHTS